MNELEKLRFNYEKNANNLSNQGELFNKFKTQPHKMKHTRNECEKLYQNFYVEYGAFSLSLANLNFEESIHDLEMYLNWLGNNGKRN